MGKHRQALGKGLGALFPGATSDSEAQAEPAGHEEEAAGNRVAELPVSEIEPNPHQPRTRFSEDGVEELANSIREKGLIQPISVRRFGAGYQLIAGERRLRASKHAGLLTIPAIVMDVTSDEAMMELSLIENIQRENLNPVEEAKAYRSLMDECFLTQEEVASRVGKDRSSVANTLRLLSLPEEVRDALEAGKIGMGHSRALLGLEDDRARVALCRQTVEQGLSVRKVEALVRKARNAGQTGPLPTPRPSRKDPQLLSFEEDLRGRFGTAVSIIAKSGKGKIEIEFYSEDDLERILEILQE